MAELGDEVKDKISGFRGIVAAKTFHLNGCVRIMVEPTELMDGKPIQEHWFDIQQIEVLNIGAFQTSEKESGGPQKDPPKW